MLARLHQAERLSDDFRDRLLAWSPSGFSVHAAQLAGPHDRAQLERLARYVTRAPMRLDALEALEQDSKGRVLVRTPPDPRTGQTHRTLDVLDWIHDVTTQIPDPGRHLVRYFGAYSCRGHIAPRPSPATEPATHTTPGSTDPRPPEPSTHATPARRASWARLLQRIFEVDPLLCRCGATMEVVSVITDSTVIDRILRHLRDRLVSEAEQPRPPPP